MSPQEVDEYLKLSHVAVLSVSREGRGPIASPIWYDVIDGAIRMVTSPNSLHGRAMQRSGRATLTVRSEEYGDEQTVERYAHVEGPIEFVDDELLPAVTAIRRRYYQVPNADAWVQQPIIESQRVALLHPERLSGFIWEASL
jgi:nitroimidazol reductase NimA-like FMN-containing flavoprotein (pyridoxamine 5'-phosphate oxidase superfamily)